VCLSYSCPGEKTVEDYNDYFFSQMKRECIEHFGNDASWSSEISDDGFETLTGAVRKNVTVQICPNPNDNLYGSVLMYDSELCKGVLDEKNTQTRSETSDGERTNDDD